MRCAWKFPFGISVRRCKVVVCVWIWFFSPIFIFFSFFFIWQLWVRSISFYPCSIRICFGRFAVLLWWRNIRECVWVTSSAYISESIYCCFNRTAAIPPDLRHSETAKKKEWTTKGESETNTQTNILFNLKGRIDHRTKRRTRKKHNKWTIYFPYVYFMYDFPVHLNVDGVVFFFFFRSMVGEINIQWR